jgi:hypothetical protein
MGTRRRTTIARVAVAVTALVALTACSGGGTDETSGTESSSGSGSSAADGTAAGSTTEELLADAPEQAREADGLDAAADTDAASGSEETTSQTANRVPVEGGLFIRTGRVTVVSDDLDAARATVERTVQRYGGQVANEQTDNEDDGDIRSSRLTLRVPSARFSTVMASFAELGDVQGSQTEQEEVTTEVIDVASRIRTQEVSLGRLRGFLDEATTVSSVIRLESEIARREADLASLRAQQDYLEDQTSLSTIDLTLRAEEPEPKPVPEKDELEDAGFLAGLSGGWNALLDVLVVAATVVGALLPFALVVALVGLPLALWLRSTRRQRRTTGASQPAA